MICRTAASCVSRLFITLCILLVLHARTHARVGKKCSVSRQYAVFGEERGEDWLALSLCLCLCVSVSVSEASQRMRVDVDQRRLASSIGKQVELVPFLSLSL